MKTSKLINIIKKGTINVPLYVLSLKNKFDLTMEEFIFLIYLSNLGDKVLFDINKFKLDLNLTTEDVLSYIDILTEKKYINIELIKNEKNVSSEYIVLDLYYDKLVTMLEEDINSNEESVNSNIFDSIEKEFGRGLTPVEFEIINAWFESGYSEEIVLEAVREATYNGVSNLRYIDKILYEWSKKNIKTKEDVLKNKNNFKEQKEEKEKLDLFDYNWLEDEE